MSRFAVDRSSGLLLGAEQRHSPNQDERPPGTDPALVVIHGISLPAGQFGTGAVDALFANCLDCSAEPAFADLTGLRVSAHLLIDRRGRVSQYVPLTRRAWHAGASCWWGRTACNDFSIGIELEGTDEIPYEDTQYAALVGVLRALRRAWSVLDAGRIVGHCDIAPARKSDPGPAFDWRRLHAALTASGSSPARATAPGRAGR